MDRPDVPADRDVQSVERGQPGVPPSGRAGLHPVLGESGDPGRPAADLLRALGSSPPPRATSRSPRDVQDHLLRTTGGVSSRSAEIRLGRLMLRHARPPLIPQVVIRHKDFRRGRGDHESPECGQGPPEDPGTVLGTDVPRAGVAVRNGLHVPEGPEEGSAQAGPAVLLPDAGREGPPGLRSRRTAPSAATCSARCRSAGWSGRSCSCPSSRCPRSRRPGRCRCCSARCPTRSCTTARRSR